MKDLFHVSNLSPGAKVFNELSVCRLHFKPSYGNVELVICIQYQRSFLYELAVTL